MDLIVKACAECTQTCCFIHGKNKSRLVTSFFKIMFGELFSKVLFLPPKFVCSAPVLDGQNAILEDSSGQIWEVKFQKSNNNLVFQQGWSTFASDHNLQVGELLLFFLTKQWHFVVKIFDRTACEKFDFSGQTRKRKRKRKTKMRQSPVEKKTDRVSDSDAAVETNCRVPAHKEDPGDEMEFMVGSRDSDEAERELNWRFNFDEWMNDSADDVACVERPLIVLDDRDDYDHGDGDVYEVAKEALSGGVSDKGSSSFAAISSLLATNVANPRERNEVAANSTEIAEALFDEGSKENISDSEIKEFLVSKETDHVLPSPDWDLDEENQQCTEKAVKEISGTSDIPENCQSGDCKILPSHECESDDENHQCTQEMVNVISGTSNIPENCQFGDDQSLSSRGCDSDKENQQCTKKVVNEISETSEIPENCQSVKGDEYNLDDGNKKCTEEDVNSISGTFNTPISVTTEKCKLEKILKSNEEELSTIQTDPCNNEASKTRHGESSKVAKRLRGQSVDTAKSEHNIVHQVVVKTEIVDSDKNYTIKTYDPIKFPPMLAICAHQHFIELPDILPFPTIKGRANIEKKVVYIRDSAMKMWPVLYHEKQATQFLKGGLDDLIEANRIKSGDQCLFTSEDEAKGIYSLRVL